MKGYYFITDAKLSKAGNLIDAENAVRSGVEIIQYREKTVSTKDMYDEALKLRQICKNTIFIVNDRIDMALAVNADGVHLGQDDMPYDIARSIMGKDKIIGVTVHSIDEAIDAFRKGANYLGISPVFSTKTKKDAGAPCGLELIRQIRKTVSIPMFGIGGINLNNTKQVIEAGASGVCAISAVISKDNVCDEIRKFQNLFKMI